MYYFLWFYISTVLFLLMFIKPGELVIVSCLKFRVRLQKNVNKIIKYMQRKKVIIKMRESRAKVLSMQALGSKIGLWSIILCGIFYSS